jgi:hypothetical protein
MKNEFANDTLKRSFFNKYNPEIGKEEIDEAISNPIIDPGREAVNKLNQLHSIQNFQIQIPKIIQKNWDESREELVESLKSVRSDVEETYQAMSERQDQTREVLQYEDLPGARSGRMGILPPFIRKAVPTSRIPDDLNDIPTKKELNKTRETRVKYPQNKPNRTVAIQRAIDEKIVQARENEIISRSNKQ